VKNKRCAIIGTSASGVQITQAWGPEAGLLKVFQRTPNLAVPMQKRNVTVKEQEDAKQWYLELFKFRKANFAGFLYD
jgi:cation diffusion facilitator CzcD-associated flavoprotein CzcO